MEKFVAYYRLSLMKKNSHGLGLEAQKDIVQKYVGKENSILIGEFTEIETGTYKKKRIVIYEALEICRKENATLIIAKLDRLTRDEVFLFTLLQSVERGQLKQFICCDNPNVTPLTLKLLSIIAADEAKRISERTKAALAAKKRQGFKLGNPQNLNAHARSKGTDALRQKALNNENNRKAKGYILLLRTQKKSFREIADILNREGFRASQGGEFHARQVNRLYCRGAISS